MTFCRIFHKGEETKIFFSKLEEIGVSVLEQLMRSPRMPHKSYEVCVQPSPKQYEEIGCSNLVITKKPYTP